VDECLAGRQRVDLSIVRFAHARLAPKRRPARALLHHVRSVAQITVNGVTAFISGNTFQALNVPLTTGANVITVTVQDTSGNLSSASITVTGTGTLVDPVQLQANLTNGFSPLSVTFYDPLAGGLGLDDWPIDTQLFMALDSFSWGSQLNCIGLNFTGPWYMFGKADNLATQNTWSWQNARQSQTNGLMSPSLASRNLYLGQAYRALGQVAHLLQDTSQPQHVRDEQHVDRKIIADRPWLSAFEKYGKDHVAYLNYTATLLDWKTAGFTKLKDFWNRGFYTWDRSTQPPPNAQPLINNEDPTQPTNKLGLAEFTNGNFIGQRHTYCEIIPPSAFFYYPLPSLTNGTDWNNLIANPAAYAKSSSFSSSFGADSTAYRFIVGKTAAQGRAVTHHGAVTYLLASAGFSTAKSIPYASCDDLDVLKDYHDALIPQAVSYSAGLMDYFFRGQLGVGLSSNSGTYSLEITNISGPGEYVEVPVPTGTSGSGTTEDGFLGLATFDVWGIDFATWQTWTGL
jgi:hypothetical protein